MSTEIGRKAEDTATAYLEKLGLKILARNWRNRWCEIDIIAQGKDKAIHFVEVKHRRTDYFGSGFDYITQDKINRLQRASLVWMSLNLSTGQAGGPDRPFQIDIISMTGPVDSPKIEYIPNAIDG